MPRKKGATANPLTPKQEKFANIYIKTNNASEAYRQAYDVKKDTKPEVIWVSAHRVLANPKVGLRVLELQERVAKRTLVTVETLTEELEAARLLATTTEQPAAVTGAVMAKARLHGLDVKKTHNIHEIEDKRLEDMMDAAEK